MRPADPHIQAQITDYWNFLIASYGCEHHHAVCDSSERAAWEADLQPLLPLDSPRFQIGDAHVLPCPAASFDAVTSHHLFWTLRDPATAFAKRARSTEPAAALLRSVGFTEVRIARLESVERLDERLAHDANRQRLPRYAVTGVRSVAQVEGPS